MKPAAAIFFLIGALSLAPGAAEARPPGAVRSAPAAPPLTEAQLDRIAKRVWQNECAGTVAGLTSWNSGENFASLGIGHFIWYPAGVRGPFDESFPPLIEWLRARGAAVPPWLAPGTPCPWPDRKSFEAARQSSEQKQLRALLAATTREQVLHIQARLLASLQQMGGRDARAAARAAALARTEAGTFALIDYVNFKGDGLGASESYRGQGWGLAQVLAEMNFDAGRSAPDSAPAEFAAAAERVLRRRVENSPPERREAKWLPGWVSRVRAYAR